MQQSRRWMALAGLAGPLLACLLLAACASSGDSGQAEAEPRAADASSWPPDVGPRTIATVVGKGEYGALGLEGPAAGAQLSTPVDVAFDAGGNLYIVERYNHRVLKVDPSGTLTVAAGTVDENGFAQPGFSGDGGPATEAKLNEANALATGPGGELYISDSRNHRIRMVDADGVITTVVGTGEQGFSGDGGPATEAALNYPLGLALDAAENLYFLDGANKRIPQVDGNGVITTVTGTGKSGLSPDGTPAAKADLGSPTDHMPVGLDFDAAGRLVFTDLENNRIQMVDANGRIRTVAGIDESVYSGDGGPAIEAGVNQPMDVAVGPDGALYISTHTHGPEGNRIRMVDADGIITTVAGNQTGYSGDGARPAERS